MLYPIQKRVANFLIRACFHEAGALKLSDPSSGPNFSGFCSREHRRPENTGHNFFDHAMGVITAIAKRTGASNMDTVAVGCFVAYEVKERKNNSFSLFRD